jgi:hypothetical protein
LSDVTAIAAGGSHSLALKGDGTVVAWGDNFSGQSTVPAGLSDVTAIAAGGAHNLALVTSAFDATAPSITINTPMDGATYTLGQVVNANYGCQDETGGSGISSCIGTAANGSPIDTSSVGDKSFTVNAVDHAGNPASSTQNYTVGYNFGDGAGFAGPVNSPPMVNTGKAGRTYPVRWQLKDANGNYISSLSAISSITYKSTSCGDFTGDPTDALETSTTGGSSLRYDSAANQFIYNWATPTTPGCYTLFLELDSGEVFFAYFNLSR